MSEPTSEFSARAQERPAADWAVRTIEPDEFHAHLRVTARAFGTVPHPDDVQLDEKVVERDRSLGAFDGDGTMVGAAGAFSLRMAVPGGADVAMAGVTAVGVLPTHRRRGVVSALMRHQLVEAAATGSEPVAALWASEYGIYGRFGYGPATNALFLRVPRRAGWRRLSPVGSAPLRLSDATDVRADLVAVHERTWHHRPGNFSRDERLWDMRLYDPPYRRGKSSPLIAVVHDGPDGPDGYALYKVSPDWEIGWLPDSTVEVLEVVAANPVTEAALWDHVMDLDLTARTILPRVAIDSPLLLAMAEPRHARPVAFDGLWVRLLSLPDALQGRRYLAPLDVVVSVTDDVLPANAGRWRVVVDRDDQTGHATVTRTDADPDVTADVAALGAAYLGGTRVHTLAGAGRVREHTDGALGALSRAFLGEVAPLCQMVF